MGGVIIKIVQVIVAKLMMTLSLASLLLNNCCVLEDLAPFRFRTVPAEEMLLQKFLTKHPRNLVFVDRVELFKLRGIKSFIAKLV